MLKTILFILTAIMSVIAFTLMYIDKQRAKKNQWRIRERTLLLTSACFGGIGGFLGMMVFRHKTKHWYFRYPLPMMAVVQIAILVYVAVAA